MKDQWLLVVLVSIISHSTFGEIRTTNLKEDDGNTYYSNEWVIRMTDDPERVRQYAEDRGYFFNGPVFGLENTYSLLKNDHPERHKREAVHLTNAITDDPRIEWGEQQRILRRSKRDLDDDVFEALTDESLLPNIRKRPDPDFLEQMQELYEEDNPKGQYEDDAGNVKELESERDDGDERDERGLMFNDGILDQIAEAFAPVYYFITKPNKWFEKPFRSYKAPNATRFNDKLWKQQWYIHKRNPSLTKDAESDTAGTSLDMRVVHSWDRGYTGKGITVTVLDDGLEGSNEDLKDNYSKEVSYDMNGNDGDPTPSNDENAHGTRCAGEIAMVANNRKCGVGVAYNVKIGGIRMLDGNVTDRLEAAALGYNFDKVDIYSASWGPTDDGKTLDGPGRMVKEALLNGATKGRGGKGSIFVWASGNGGLKGDSCAADGYVNSIYTLTVSSVSQGGDFPWYGERCSATLTSTYSSGNYREGQIVSTDINNGCTARHTGTSASAPLAAGIIALLLESRPDLTWRDVQHIVVLTSRYEPLKQEKGWFTNAVGRNVSTRFGYGLIDSLGMIEAAEKWESLPPSSNCSFDFEIKNKAVKPGEKINIEVPVECTSVKYMEHIELTININAPIRGALELHLTSPQNTRTQLLFRRRRDRSSQGFNNWKFMSVLTWNEKPSGKWIVEVLDTRVCPSKKIDCSNGSVGNMSIVIYGNENKPSYLKSDNLADVKYRINSGLEEESDSFLNTLLKKFRQF